MTDLRNFLGEGAHAGQAFGVRFPWPIWPKIGNAKFTAIAAKKVEAEGDVSGIVKGKLRVELLDDKSCRLVLNGASIDAKYHVSGVTLNIDHLPFISWIQVWRDGKSTMVKTGPIPTGVTYWLDPGWADAALGATEEGSGPSQDPA